MKRWIVASEWYPVYTLEETYQGRVIELTEDELLDYEEVMRRFEEWQDRLIRIEPEP